MSQKGYQISYQIGFDCHGLQLEQEAEKVVGKVGPNDSIEKLTVVGVPTAELNNAELPPDNMVFPACFTFIS